jgi:hypothetical protein
LIRLARLLDPIADEARERLVAFRILVLVVDAGLLGSLLTDLGAALFNVFVHELFCTRNECG